MILTAGWDRLGVDAFLLALAAFLGSMIGWQREAQARPAGLRTHILVAVGSCLLSLVRFPGGDPARIAAQVVTGIGFLGAGVILRRGPSVRGLTTAASIWAVAGIGIAVGAGGVNAVLAGVATAIVLFTLEAGKRVEHWIRRTNPEATLLLSVPQLPGATARVMSALTGAGATILSLELESATAPLAPDTPVRRGMVVIIRLDGNVTREEIVEAVSVAHPDIGVVWL
ncbi:MAG: MgtC/SapB family protein [Armatimonadota bacterium]